MVWLSDTIFQAIGCGGVEVCVPHVYLVCTLFLSLYCVNIVL